MTKDESILLVLKVLKSPMMMMGPTKNQALSLCEDHSITAKDLLEAFEKICWKV